MKSIALILAGGTGAKLYPRSTEHHPKQLIHLLGEGTMIQNTIMRLLPVFQPEDIYVITNADLAPIVQDQLPIIPAHNIIMEPFRRNTAPSLALSNVIFRSRYNSDTVVTAIPSDHLVQNIGEFHQSLDVAQRAAFETKGIVTIGLTPTRPETGYGYLQINDERVQGSWQSDTVTSHVHAVNVFAEKPDVATAQRFIDAGDFLWNSGMFVYRLDVFDKEFSQYLPEHAPFFESLVAATDINDFNIKAHTAYRTIRPVSMDYGIMEKTRNAYCVMSTFEWSDVGTWDELYRISKKDTRGNVLEGDVFAINTRNSFISSYGRVIGAVGIDDLIVVDTPQLLLITKRGTTENVTELVDLLRRKHVNTLL